MDDDADPADVINGLETLPSLETIKAKIAECFWPSSPKFPLNTGTEAKVGSRTTINPLQEKLEPGATSNQKNAQKQLDIYFMILSLKEADIDKENDKICERKNELDEREKSLNNREAQIIADRDRFNRDKEEWKVEKDSQGEVIDVSSEPHNQKKSKRIKLFPTVQRMKRTNAGKPPQRF